MLVFGKIRQAFSLRTLLLLVTCLAVPCGWLAHHVRQGARQAGAVRELEPRNVVVFYRQEWRSDATMSYVCYRLGLRPAELNQKTGFLSRMLGKHLGTRVCAVHVPAPQNPLAASHFTDQDVAVLLKLRTDLEYLYIEDGMQLTDAALEQIGKLSHLKELTLADAAITARGIRHLQGLRKLQRIDLDNCPIGDAGLEELAKLQSLRLVTLEGTQATFGGLDTLRIQLPQATIEGGHVLLRRDDINEGAPAPPPAAVTR